MTRYIAFLRGINVSGQKLIKMEDLRQYFEVAGFENVVTYIQSGNVLFDTAEKDEASLRKKVETLLADKLGYDVPTIIRSIKDLKKVVKNIPFQNLSTETRKLHVTFLSAIPAASQKGSLDAFKNEVEEVCVINREVYLLTEAYGNSKLSNTLMEKKLGVTATSRNLATINKILTL